MPASLIMSLYEKAWQAMQQRIARAADAAGRDPATIRLLAVSKSMPAEAIRAVHALGQRAFGENYVQEATAKMTALADLPGIEWHLIGPLQRNKARAAAAQFAGVQTIDGMAIAERLSATREARQGLLDVCVQVNISAETSKSGIAPGDALALARAVVSLPRLALRGFMGIAAPTAEVDLQRAQFRMLREILAAAQAEGLMLDTLSMGMSDDLEAAVLEGATMVRIGTAIFGARDYSN
jgi:pyridoxal phosphate enzyme (YggS family)